jgi:prenyltransferase beta subunit
VAAPHLIMTYCALLALAVLRDDYALLDRTALARMVGACQAADGGCVLYDRQRAVNMDFVDF